MVPLVFFCVCLSGRLSVCLSLSDLFIVHLLVGKKGKYKLSFLLSFGWHSLAKFLNMLLSSKSSGIFYRCQMLKL